MFAFLLFVGMFKAGPMIMQWWNDTFDTPEPHITFMFIIFSNMIVLSGSFNFTVWALSKLKIPFFEQYRINPNVFPSSFSNPGHGNKPTLKRLRKRSVYSNILICTEASNI
jgi:hypothetical protein